MAALFVKSASARINNAGLQTTTKVCDGHPRVAIAEHAGMGTDLVMVGSHAAVISCASCSAVSLRPHFASGGVQASLNYSPK